MPVRPPTSLLVSFMQPKFERQWQERTEVLILVKISLHRAEQARYRRVTWYRFISVMAFFHSAEVKGIDGRETGACWDCRLMAFGRTGGLDSLITGTSLALRLCFGEMGGEREFLWDLALLSIGRDPKFAELGLERTSGIRPLGMASKIQVLVGRIQWAVVEKGQTAERWRWFWLRDFGRGLLRCISL